MCPAKNNWFDNFTLKDIENCFNRLKPTVDKKIMKSFKRKSSATRVMRYWCFIVTEIKKKYRFNIINNEIELNIKRPTNNYTWAMRVISAFLQSNCGDAPFPGKREWKNIFIERTNEILSDLVITLVVNMKRHRKDNHIIYMKQHGWKLDEIDWMEDE
uniref:Death domain-containing protein n=1 Tax=Caenorhabditis tropicalis TaxID=1561998 RepID=A0A1I7TN42_9PELO